MKFDSLLKGALLYVKAQEVPLGCQNTKGCKKLKCFSGTSIGQARWNMAWWGAFVTRQRLTSPRAVQAASWLVCELAFRKLGYPLNCVLGLYRFHNQDVGKISRLNREKPPKEVSFYHFTATIRVSSITVSIKVNLRLHWKWGPGVKCGSADLRCNDFKCVKCGCCCGWKSAFYPCTKFRCD